MSGIARKLMMTAGHSAEAPDPEEGLTLTYSEPVGEVSAYTATERSQPVVMACEVTFPSVPADGIINEFGGNVIGSFVGLRDGGTVLRFRAGDASNPIDATEGVQLDVTPPNDINVHTLVWEYTPLPTGQLRAWMDGVFLGGVKTAGSGALQSNFWAGVEQGGYGTVGQLRAPAGEPLDDWGGTLESNLRVYINQTVDLPGEVVEQENSFLSPGLYLLRTISGENNAWVQYTDYISPYANASNARLVFEYQNGTGGVIYRGDIQIDAVDFDGTFYSFENTGQSWETSANGEMSYGSVSWQGLTVATSGGLRWLVDSGGTSSTNTGRTDAADGSYYVYAETSSPTGSGDYFWLRSPAKALSGSPTLSYWVARYGDNIGTLKVYLEVL